MKEGGTVLLLQGVSGLSEIIEWGYDFPYHPIILFILITAEVLFWLGFSSLVYNWLHGKPLKIERENESESEPESGDVINPVFEYGELE